MRIGTIVLGALAGGAVVTLIVVASVRVLDTPVTPVHAPSPAEAPKVASTAVETGRSSPAVPSDALGKPEETKVAPSTEPRTTTRAAAQPADRGSVEQETVRRDARDDGTLQAVAPAAARSPVPLENSVRSAMPTATVPVGTVVPPRASVPAPVPVPDPAVPKQTRPSTSPSDRSPSQQSQPPSPAPSDTRVWMVAEPSEAAVGSSITVHVLIDGASDAASVPFHVVFNPAVLRFEHGEEGAFLSGGAQTAFFASPTSTGERVVVGLSRLGGGQGKSGSGELCRLRFTAVGVGDSGLAFDRAKVRGETNTILPANFAATAVVVR